MKLNTSHFVFKQIKSEIIKYKIMMQVIHDKQEVEPVKHVKIMWKQQQTHVTYQCLFLSHDTSHVVDLLTPYSQCVDWKYLGEALK